LGVPGCTEVTSEDEDAQSEALRWSRIAAEIEVANDGVELVAEFRNIDAGAVQS